jgi:H+/Cl- antiporter ClcA
MKHLKTTLKIVGALTAAALCATAFAAPLGAVLQQSASNNFGGINTFATGGAYVGGVISGITGIFKIRKYMKDPDRESLVPAAGFLLAAALLLALPSALSTGVDTVFSSGSTANTINGSLR